MADRLFQGVRFFLYGFDPIIKKQARLKLLEGGGVEVSRCGDDCTHLIVDKVVYDDPVCVVARGGGKVVVTSLWVEHSCELGMLVDVTPIIYRPVRDLNGIPGAKSFVICLTGYQRQDREDIMTMVGLMGATFSKPLVASKITHLVCFKFEGEKYELAKMIGKIKLVNHCWLEDCLRAWEILPEADYNKSSHEFEIMEAEAKDSEEEREQVPTEPHSGRKVQTPQNLRTGRSPHQPSLEESEILKNSTFLNASKILAAPDHCSDVPSAIKRNATSCSTSGLERMQNTISDMPDALDTHTFGKPSGVPSNQYDTAITPEKVRANLASTSRTEEKSPSNSSTRSYSRRNPTKVSLLLSSAQRKSNRASALTEDKSTFNVSAGFNLSLPIENPNGSLSAAVKTPVRRLSYLEQRTTDELTDRRKVGVSSHSGKSPKQSDDVAVLARSSNTGDKSEIVGYLSSSKATSCTEDRHDVNHPSHVELIEDIWKSSNPVKSNLSKEVGPNSSPKQGRNKMLPGKVLVSMSNKGSIHSSSSRGKQLEQCQSGRVKLLDVSADKTINATMQTSNIEEPRSLTSTKDRPLDDETETPDAVGDVFNAACDKNELDNMTSEKELSASDGAKDDDKTMGGNECMPTNKVNGKCAAVCSSRVELNGTTKEHTTDERKDKGRKRSLAKTMEHSKVSKDVSNGDTREKMPKKMKNDGKMEKKGKNPLTTSGRAKADDQVICGNEAAAKSKENSKCNTACSAGDALKIASIENTTDEPKDKPRKRPLTKLENHQNLKKAANKQGTRGNVANISKKDEKTEKGKPLSSPQVEKENSSMIIPDNGGEWQSGKVTAKSKKTPSLTELKGVATNQGPEPAEHAPKKVKDIVWFLVSGHRFQRKEFQQVIKRLRGRVCRDSHNWSYQATHLILPDPIRRTEKFFGAAASGRWILKTDYLTASNEAGRFLDEHPYEWHKNSLTEDGSINLVAPRKWRLIREQTGHGAFYGMRILVYGECIAPSLDTLKRAVKAGDGTILATSPPYTRFLESGVDFAIVSPGMPRVDIWVQEFLRHEIPCVLADYLVEYVCKPGYSLDKHVQYGTHSWAEKSLKNLVSRMKEIVDDHQASPEDTDSESDVACQICESRDRGEVMLICGDESGLSGCGTGIHIDCCDPPLSKVPEGDWFCSKCRTIGSGTTKKSRGNKK